LQLKKKRVDIKKVAIILLEEKNYSPMSLNLVDTRPRPTKIFIRDVVLRHLLEGPRYQEVLVRLVYFTAVTTIGGEQIKAETTALG